MACRRTAAWNIIGLVFKYGCRLLLESHRWSWWTHLDWFCVSAAVESHCCSLCMLGETVCSLMNIYCWLCENMELHQVIHQHENSDIYCFMIFFAFWLLIGATLWHKRSTKRFQIATLWPSPQIHKADLIWCTFTAGINQLRTTVRSALLQAGSWKWLIVCPALEAVLTSTIIKPCWCIQGRLSWVHRKVDLQLPRKADILRRSNPEDECKLFKHVNWIYSSTLHQSTETVAWKALYILK